MDVRIFREPLAATYDPDNKQWVERDLYDWWEQQGLFTSHESSKENDTFTMLLPPPNVTGSLHIGHALTAYIQDAIVRWHRMQGKSVQWIPGTDHASIATQTIVEKQLWKEHKKRRMDMTRDEFLSHVWQWKNQCGDRIFQQLRRVGASLDWTHTYFTMDDTRSLAVNMAFCRLYNDGLIYRDTRLVNWCCALRTVISDIEIDYEDINGRTLVSVPNQSKPVEFGVLHQIAYPVETNSNSNDMRELIVGTTRLETILADCALAVHPDDIRYKDYIGHHVRHPITQQLMPIIADEQLVDPEFGTGVVKITPAHDPNDYACARRHQLPVIGVFNMDGTINEHCPLPELIGMNRFDVRSLLLEQYKKTGYYRGADTQHVTRIGRCSRTGDIIEPMLRPQWYVKCSTMAQKVLDQLENDTTEHTQPYQIIPHHYKAEWRRWLVIIKGLPSSTHQHQIDDIWVVAMTESDAYMEAKKKLTHMGYDTSTITFRLEQDHDVLDTWFSSGLLPLSALGWTRDTNAIPSKYPLNLMETGGDIIFFWVARMAMLCSHLSGVFPFHTIALHPMVRDTQGRKMSKSLGNVIDPLHVIEGRSQLQLQTGIEERMPACGSDALRMALLLATQQTRQINMDMNNVVSANHFANKLWNLTKLTLSRLDVLLNESSTIIDVTKYRVDVDVDVNQLSLLSRYLLSRLARTTMTIDTALHQLHLDDATNAIRRFILSDICDTFVEFIKPALYHEDTQVQWSELRTLVYVLETTLRLLHPMMPFVTERLWQQLQWRVAPASNTSIMIADYPLPNERLNLFLSNTAEQDMEAKLVSNEILSSNDTLQTQLNSHSVVMAIRPDLKVYLPVESIPDRSRVVARFIQKRDKLHRELMRVQSRMDKPEYKQRVPATIQETDRQQSMLLKVQIQELEHSISLLQSSSNMK
ncbi:tRNA synthetases class I-domain-containing protein [Syncephalis plumigaleata]|nr:tRNA synthetases class I-domain-containing protein [Syncephalis plumigaleata]